MELFQERGYAETTVQEIAAHAGLTERTFFRYFSDKREVLFSGSSELERLVTSGIAAAADTSTPFEAVARGLEATAPLFEQRRSHARKRRVLVAAHAELRERELIKLAALGTAMAESLRKRGVSRTIATLVAETGIALFKTAFESWVDDTSAKKNDLAHHVRAAVAQLRSVAAAGSAPTRNDSPRARRAEPRPKPSETSGQGRGAKK